MKKTLILFVTIILSTTILFSQNGDFESWTVGVPDYWTTIESGITVTEETTVIHGGSSSASINVTTGDQGSTDFRQNYNVTNGTTYDFSVWIYHTDGGVRARFYVDGYRNYSEPTTTGTWQQITYLYTATADETIEIGLRFYDVSPNFDGSEIVYVDDFIIPDNSVAEVAPSISLTSPTDATPNAPIAANIDITFSEDVTTAGAWYAISGTTSGIHTAVVSGGPISYTLNPDADFGETETVTVTVYAAQIADVDTDDPPDNMVADYTFTFTTASPSTGWIINELLADPAADLPGDANGDGVRHFSDDEFIEIVNTTGGAVDISGWTLSDGVTRHTFPTGTIVLDQSAIVVFGGGTPTGVFGKALVQTSSTGNLGFANGGDTVTLNNGTTDVVTYLYGGEGGDNQSLTRDPDITGADPLVKHSTATNSGGALFSPGNKLGGTPFTGAYAAIFEIQGSSMVDPYASPYVTQVVATAENIVTAVGPEGFHIQTQTTRTDNDENTSDGVYVYTGAAPTVAVRDMVNVTATVTEYYELTELTAPIIVGAGTGTVPEAKIFDANTPSPDPTIPFATIEFERFEGMLVSITGGVVNASNQSFGSDPIAEVYITAGTSRVFRETGIKYPGIAGIPIWDGNPELFELDPDRLGLPNLEIYGGSTFDAVGVLGFEYGDYELWPTSLSVTQPPLTDLSVSGGSAGQFSVGAFNMYRPSESSDPSVRYQKLSKYIIEILQSPDILAVSEIANITVLQTIATQITTDGGLTYTAYLEEGNDFGGIDVGYLVNEARVTDVTITQLGKDEFWDDPKYGVSTPVHDRPPLLLEGRFLVSSTPYLYTPISVIAVHSKSLSGSDESRNQQKRLNQAQSIAQMVQDLQTADPEINLVVTGDFNAFQFTDGYVDVLGQIRGEVTPADNVLSATVITNPQLINTTDNSPTSAPKIVMPLADDADRSSYNYQGSAQVLDHALVSSNLAPVVTNQEFGSANADVPEVNETDPTTALRASDHDGLVIYINAIDIALPVELSSFTANDLNGTVIVEWTTESEIENLGFIVERKTADAEWDEIVSYKSDDALLGQGTVSYATDYKYIDALAEFGTTYEYRLADVDYNGVVTYHGTRKVTVESTTIADLPVEYALEANYPNPFNPVTTIKYSLPEDGMVTITIYDASGRQIKTLMDRQLSAGYHSMIWDSTDNGGNVVGAGIYFYSISADNFQQTRKMLLIK